MKKFIILLAMCFIFSGCGSLIPNLKFGNPVTTPESTQKSKKVMKCKGEIHLDDFGRVISCTDGYYSNENSYNKKERKMTFVERIKGFVNNLVGFGFWGLVLLLFLCPSLIGLIVGRLTEGAMGAGASTLKAVSRAIQRARKGDIPLNASLDAELDEKHKIFIRKLKDKEKIR